MIRFINLKTGNIYNGDTPYIHWFEGEQSTGLIYCQPICIISDQQLINISIDSEVFKLLNVSNFGNDIDINGFKYKDITEFECNSMSSDGYMYKDYFIHLIYFKGQSDIGAEIIDNFYIEDGGETLTFKIGADFYEEDESLYINLSNFGVEIPESIQKSIYSNNIHDDKKDNILLNRKFKELLSNYWDMIANKGSYKSLLTSLKWFEWGDMVRLREIWKTEDLGKTTYNDRPLKSILEDKYIDTLDNFAKTTYLALYNTLQDIQVDSYDSEFNPTLAQKVLDWSKADISLKMCMLGHFYETYFMPIHLDLIHSTIEDIVFTNTIKIINGGCIDREDSWVDLGYEFECNIKDGDTFSLTNVNVGVDNKTLFGCEANNESRILGVEDIKDIGVENENELKVLLSQYYNGIGVIIPFKCKFDLNDDEIYKEIIYVNQKLPNGKSFIDTYEDSFVYSDEISFKILLKNIGETDISLQFISKKGKRFIKNLHINIVDDINISLNIYKVIRNNDFTLNDLFKGVSNEYMMGLKRGVCEKYYKQYIVGDKSDDIYSGIGLNYVMIIENDGNNLKDLDQSVKNILNEYFYILKKTPISEDLYKYYICISKDFNYHPSDHRRFHNGIKKYIYKEGYEYYPEFHKLEPFPYFTNSHTVEDSTPTDFTISQYDTLVVIPTINGNDETDYLRYCKNSRWKFINESTGKIIGYDNISQPNILDKTQSLPDGYYTIKFSYNLGNDVKEVSLNSSFIKKTI